MIDIDHHDERPSNEETEEFLAENYLNKLLKGDELKFIVSKLMGKLNGLPYISFNQNRRLWRIYKTICKAMEIRNLNLKFEYEDEMWTFNPKEDIFCDDIDGKFRKYKDFGLLIHNYE